MTGGCGHNATMQPKKPKLCGCPEGLADPKACKSWGRHNRYHARLENPDWAILFVNALAAVAVFALIPSWKVALGLVAVSAAVGMTAPASTLATVIGPAHMASSVYLVACGLQNYAGMTSKASRITALVGLLLLSACLAQLARNQYSEAADHEHPELAVVSKNM